MMTVGIVLIMLVAALGLWFFTAGPALPKETDEIIDRVMDGELPELIAGETGLVMSDGLEIWYERILPGCPLKGTVLLLMGSGGSALEWPQDLLEKLLESGYQVVRYDHRGTGMSDWVADWDAKNPYTLAQMAGDVVAILDALAVEQAHLIGLSMGGMIAQEIAIRYPARAKSLTLMMTSGYVADPDLPGLSSRYFFSSLLKGIPLLRYRLLGGERNLIKERIAKMISTSGYKHLDIETIAQLVLYDLRKRRGVSISGAFQHQQAVKASGSRYEQLKALELPVLVIHGTADPIMPIEHGRKLVELIPRAKGLWLEESGHVFPAAEMDKLIKEIRLHLDGAQ